MPSALGLTATGCLISFIISEKLDMRKINTLVLGISFAC